jgi:hypothetical protein
LGEIGLAVTTGESLLIRRLALLGIGSIGPADGLDVLDEIQRRDMTQSLVLPIDWARAIQIQGAVNVPTLLRPSAGRRNQGSKDFSVCEKGKGPRKRTITKRSPCALFSRRASAVYSVRI